MTVPQIFMNVRAGRHDCYDRLVFDARGKKNVTWYAVHYVAAVVHSDGRPFPLRGGAKLSIVLMAYDHGRYANRNELVNVSGYRTFRQVAWADSERITTSFGVGVRARLPFRVFTLPGRVVVDVAHHW